MARGIDLGDLYRLGGGASKLTYRRLAVLLEHLPGDSAYKTAVRDTLTDEQLAEMAKQPRDRHGAWSHLELLVAALIDRVELLRRDTVAVQGIKPAGEFKPVPRPGVLPARKALSEEGRRYLQRIRAEHEALHGDTSGGRAG